MTAPTKLSHQQLVGWVQAFVAILIFLGINQVMGRFSAVKLDVSPVIYSCAAFSSCAFILLFIGGKGPLAKETMRSADTWVYGTILMMSYIIGLLLFSYVTSTEGTMLQKISVLLGLLGSWLFIGRRPDRYQLIGTAIVTLGVILVCMGLKSDNRGAVYMLALLYGGLQVARIFAAELHRPHAKAAQQAKDPRAKARVVGFVMFIVSMVFLLLTLLIALAQEAQSHQTIQGLPVMADFFHAPTIFAGMLAGVFIVAPSRILEFSSSYVIKAENFTAVTTLSFVATLFWEWATSPLTGLSIKTITAQDIVAGGLITGGGLFIALTRKRAQKRQVWQNYLAYTTQDLEAVDDTREMVANTLEHFGKNPEKSAQALGLPLTVLEAILRDDDKLLAFKPEVMQKISRNYRRHVAQADALTGLLNRSGFKAAMTEMATQTDTFTLMYIDLDKFKPINDTYGHDAGDAVLVEVAQRMRATLPTEAALGRLGGDEFCILLPQTGKKAQEYSDKLAQAIAQPMEAAGHSVTVGASIGLAIYPQDGTDPQALLQAADSSMYATKKR